MKKHGFWLFPLKRTCNLADVIDVSSWVAQLMDHEMDAQDFYCLLWGCDKLYSKEAREGIVVMLYQEARGNQDVNILNWLYDQGHNVPDLNLIYVSLAQSNQWYRDWLESKGYVQNGKPFFLSPHPYGPTIEYIKKE